jgi:hypothetical protein
VRARRRQSGLDRGARCWRGGTRGGAGLEHGQRSRGRIGNKLRGPRAARAERRAGRVATVRGRLGRLTSRHRLPPRRRQRAADRTSDPAGFKRASSRQRRTPGTGRTGPSGTTFELRVAEARQAIRAVSIWCRPALLASGRWLDVVAPSAWPGRRRLFNRARSPLELPRRWLDNVCVMCPAAGGRPRPR